MGKVSNENDVLKLVRPGGLVELYKSPIKAAQVLEKYPRHCVTRPDVFKFPYIVVKPESVLKPGRVFFIVPKHTIRRLLQSKGHRPEYPADHNDQDFNKQELEEDLEPNIHRRPTRQSSEKTLRQMEEIDTSFFQKIVPLEKFLLKKESNRELKVVPQRQVANLSVEEKGAKDDNYDSDEAYAGAVSCFPSLKKCGGAVESSNDSSTTKTTVTGLKSCLKMHRKNKPRSQQGPRVRFTLPGEEDDKENWETEYPDF